MGTIYRYQRQIASGGIQLVEKRAFTGSFDEISLQYPEGAYVTFRTYEHNKAFHLQDHISRLITTLRVAIIDSQSINLDIRKALQGLFQIPMSSDQRIRMIIPYDNIDTLIVLTEEVVEPERKEYDLGVDVVTAQRERSEPERKQTGFISASKDLRSKIIGDVKEILLVNREGYILEGLSSNVFFVRKNTVYTAGEGILTGVTRKVVLDACSENSIAVKLEAVRLDELSKLDEAFITSTSRAVLPVISIDGCLIGGGLPGQITRRIMEGFEARISEGLEDL